MIVVASCVRAPAGAQPPGPVSGCDGEICRRLTAVEGGMPLRSQLGHARRQGRPCCAQAQESASSQSPTSCIKFATHLCECVSCCTQGSPTDAACGCGDWAMFAIDDHRHSATRRAGLSQRRAVWAADHRSEGSTPLRAPAGWLTGCYMSRHAALRRLDSQCLQVCSSGQHSIL